MDMDREQKSSEVVEAQQISPRLARHVLCSSATNEELEEVGSFYEIDRSRLPPDSPSQLPRCRVVMVIAKTEHNVSVRFPSWPSIQEYFWDKPSGEERGKMYPTLDQTWEMGLDISSQVLFRQIPTEEFSEQRNLPSFWSVDKLEDKELSISPRDGGALGDLISKRGKCWSELKCEGVVNWGTRRKVTFLSRYFGKKSKRLLSTDVKEEETGGEEETGDADKMELPTTRRSRKRKRHNFNRTFKPKREKKQQSSGCTGRILKDSKDRWSTERYEAAEENMLKILKAKKAVFGNPILRPELRQEARKKIGDTGLLDHLLKHMAGKVAPGGAERFRRRHNADGAMEYWLESADLVSIRREAGVQDPYWTPPPGWKPGDSPTQDPACAKQLKQLKEEVAQMKRVMEELLSKKQPEGSSDMGHQTIPIHHTDSLHPLKKMQQDLLEMKAKIDEHLSKISNDMEGKKEEMGELISSRVEEPAEKKSDSQGKAMVPAGSVLVSTAGRGEKAEEETKEGKEVEEASVGEDERKQKGGSKSAEKAAIIQRLKSGFRLCKPQGTFLWPSSTAVPRQAVVQVEDFLALPTPPSVSSSTTTSPPLPLPPPPPLRPSHPISPVKPLAKKPRVNLSPHPTVTLINLNELPSATASTTNANPSRGTFSSTSTSQPNRAVAITNVLPRDKNGMGVVNTWEGLAGLESKNFIVHSHQWQQRTGYSTTSTSSSSSTSTTTTHTPTPPFASASNTSLAMGLGTWLALSSPNSTGNSHRN